MKYVALLRGINVGGKKRVEMARLKRLFESLDFEEVVTYINSGNIIFSTNQQSVIELTERIETALEIEFGFAVRVVLRTLTSIEAILSYVPEDWTNDSAMKTDVLFLWPEFDSPKVIDALSFKPEFETVHYVEGAIVWSVPRDYANKSGLLKIVGTKFYRHVTIRNINTVRKLRDLMLSEQ